MAAAIEKLVKQLEDSGIIAQGKLEGFIPPKAHPQNAEELISELVKQNHLTKFQAQQIAQGKVRALIMGNYTVLDKIGAGGMGQVFKAQHRRMKRIVAIKMLPAAMMKDAAAAARFQREVEAAAKLSHPNIVAAYDADEANGTHFLVMEYVEGNDLAHLVKARGPLPIEDAVNYITQAARGLAFAHSKGVVHRDIKPANLLLDNEGTVKILDMGLARFDDGLAAAAADEEGLTQSGQVMGTVDYMAPEQAMDTRHADARADIYSLGCSLYRLLIGENMYQGETPMQKLMAHQTKSIPALGDKRAEVPPAIDAVFQRMVAKTPEERYQKMAEVLADLERANSPDLATEVVDSKLTSFLQSQREATATRIKNVSGTEASLKSSTGLGVGQTDVYRGGEDKTDPQSEMIGDRSQWTGNRDQGRRNNKPPLKLIAAGLGGFAVLILGVILIIRNQMGEEVARVEATPGTKVSVPAGGTVEVAAPSEVPTSKPEVPSVAPKVGGSPIVGKTPVSVVPGSSSQLSQSEILTSPDWVWSEPEKVDINVNGPAISGDGLLLVNNGSNAGVLGNNDLWIRERRSLDKPFGNKTNLGPAVNSEVEEGYAWLSADGLTLMFASSRQPSLGHNDLWIATRRSRGESFGTATSLGEPVNSVEYEPGGALSADGLTLVFSSKRKGGIGGLDLWQCKRKDAQSPFDQPQNLGPTVNSTLDEQRPWLSADGRVLLFSAVELSKDDLLEKGRKRGGKGSLWMAVRPSVEAPFGVRQELGAPIAAEGVKNTSPTVTADGKLLFFNSLRADGASTNELWMSRRVPKTKPAAPTEPLASTSGAASPFDVLKREDIPVDALTAAGLGDPAKAPPEIVRIIGKSNDVWTGSLRMAICPDGRTDNAHVLGARKRIYFWSVDGKSTGTIDKLESAVTALALSADGKWLATAHDDRTVKLWDTAARTATASIACGEFVAGSLAFSPDGKFLAGGSQRLSDDKSSGARLWDVAGRKEIAKLSGHTGAVPLAFSPDGRILATVGSNEIVRLWDGATGRDVGSIPSKFGNVVSIMFTPDGHGVITVGSGGRLWQGNLDSKQGVKTFTLPGARHDAALSPDGRTVATAGGDGAVCLCDVESGAELRCIQLGRPEGQINQVVFDATGRYLFTANGNGTMYVLRLESPTTAPRTSVTSAGPAQIATQRELAEWVIRAGGRLNLAARGGIIARIEDLPPDPKLGWILFDKRSQLTDAQLAQLATGPLPASLVLTGTQITDAGMAHLASLQMLRNLNLNQTAITDTGLMHLKALTKLQNLNMVSTAVTDEGLAKLAPLASLRKLDVRGTKVTAAGVARLQQSLPTCEILWKGAAPTDDEAALLEAISSATAIPQIKSQRELAEWVIGMGGVVQSVGGKKITKVADLPENLQFVGIGLNAIKKIDDAVFGQMASWPLPANVSVDGSSITDAGVAAFLAGSSTRNYFSISRTAVTGTGLAAAKGKRIGSLMLHYCPLTADGLKCLGDVGPINRLGIGHAQVNDEGLLQIARHTELLALNIEANPISDAGLAQLKGLTKLDSLVLNRIPINDAGLVHLESLKSLTSLDMRGSKVTKAGVDKLQKALPNCKIEWQGAAPTIDETASLRDEPTLPQIKTQRELAEWAIGMGGRVKLVGKNGPEINKLADLPPEPALQWLILFGVKAVDDALLAQIATWPLPPAISLGDTSITDAGLAHLQGLPQLTLILNRTKVTDAGLVHLADLTRLRNLHLTSCRITDGGLGTLEALKSLKSLDVRGTQVTAAGVAKLQKALPDCQIDWRGPAPTADDLTLLDSPAAVPQIKAQRELAEWVIGMGGAVGVNGGKSVTQLADLPADLKLDAVILDGVKKLDDALLAQMASWPLPRVFKLSKTSITGEGFAAFKGKSFQNLSVSNNQFSGEGLKCVSELGPINQLYIGHSRMSDQSLALLARHTELSNLQVGGNPISDAGLIHLRALVNLNRLSLSTTQVTDAGLANLESLKKLRELKLQITKVTAAGVAKLQKALPDCKIEWQGAAPTTDDEALMDVGDPTKPKTPQSAASGKK